MLIIVTATIKPSSDVPFLKLSNVNERLEQYIESIIKLFDCENIEKVIFCDNSNYVIDCNRLYESAKLKNVSFEYLHFKGDSSKVSSKGKGYGEGEIINFILENSKLIIGENYFFKLTGRLRVANLNKILNKTKNNINYFNTSSFKNKNSVDTRFYGISVKQYNEYFRNAYHQVDDKNHVYLEHVFFNIIKQKKINSINMPFYPVFIGQSGSTGKLYEENLFKDNIRNLMHKMNLYNVN